MPSFRLNRRALLRGTGGVAIALPWLEIMTGGRESRAQGAPARRFVAVFNPGGSILSNWTPQGTETDFVLSPILQPFTDVKTALTVLSGIDMKSAVGEQNAAGMIAWLTGTTQSTTQDYATGPSIDQVLAPALSSGQKLPSLNLAVRWGTGRCRGVVSPWDIVSYSNDEAFTPVAPRIDPVMIFNDLFGGDLNADAVWDQSVLDAVGRRYVNLAMRLGQADRMRLEQHLNSIRELEKGIASNAKCQKPTLVDTSDYDPAAGLTGTDAGNVDDPVTDAAIPKVGKLMMDMLVMSLACDITSVATLQWADSESKYSLPWLGLTQTHYYYQNGGGFHPPECTTINTWFMQQNAYLLEEMAKVDLGGHSLLDESVVFFGSNIQDPATHQKTNMPFLLGGRGGGLRSGRFLTYDHRSHNDLLVSLLNLFGDPRMTFGTPVHNVAPLPGLV